MTSCPSCEEAYDPEAKRPRMLHCGHSLCTPCLVRLHSLNYGVIPCPRCEGEDLYDDVYKLPFNLDLEERVASLSLEDQEQEEAVAAGVSSAESEGSPWDACPSHGSPLSSWCATCRLAVCAECLQFHGGRKKHQVVDYRRARELLLSRYEDESLAFLEWLVRVEAATRVTLEAAEAAVPPLRQTLSLLESHIGRARGHGQTLEDTASLDALEDLLEKRSRWIRRSRAAAQQQVDEAAASLGRIESAAAELRRLQEELEDGLARTGGPAPAASAATEEEPDEEAALPTTARVSVVVAQSGPFSLAPYKERTLALPPRGAGQGEGEGPGGSRTMTTHLEFKARDEGRSDCKWFLVEYFRRSGADAEFLFGTRWDFEDDRVEMWARDPTTGRDVEADGLPPARRGLFWWATGRRTRWDTVHRGRIQESRDQYEVFLDGVRMGRVEKAGGPSTPPEADMIELYNIYDHLDISKFFVETD